MHPALTAAIAVEAFYSPRLPPSGSDLAYFWFRLVVEAVIGLIR